MSEIERGSSLLSGICHVVPLASGVETKHGVTIRQEVGPRVNIGSAFQRWRELKEREGLRSDAEVALFLLDR